MQVKRIVTNIKATNLSEADIFYRDIFGLELAMDQGWIRTYVSKQVMPVQISIASEGGSGTEVPNLSIEVDDLDEALHRIKMAGCVIEYGPVTEPWGARRFYVRDPFGQLINVMTHV